MPYTHYIDVKIDKQTVEIGKPEDLGLRYSYALEDPENFEQKQGGISLNVLLPATPANNAIFNSFHNPNIVDLTGTNAFTSWRSCRIIVNGVELVSGSAMLQNGTHTRIPGTYSINCYNQNREWVAAMKDLTLWDCLNTNPHTFNVATVENSWDHFDDDENHDFVYAPVRYRQPFGVNDDTVSIYHLRPSLSIYWLLMRGFRQFGLSVKSDFLNNAQHFRRMVLPWVFGDFYDINSQLTDGVGFKAVGVLPLPVPSPDATLFPGAPPIYSGDPAFPATDAGWGGAVSGPMGITGTKYVFTDVAGGWGVFDMSNVIPPQGYDNFGLYSFDNATGKMKYIYDPPAELFLYTGNSVAINFAISLYLGMQIVPGSNIDLQLEVKKNGVLLSSNSVLPLGVPFGGPNYPSAAEAYYPISQTVYNFTVAGINQGDVLEFRLKFVQTGANPAAVKLCCAGYINVNPTATHASTWQYNFVTQRWENIDSNIADYIWQPAWSTLQITGLQLVLGGPVHFQWYDKFRSYKFLDLLRGVLDLFNLSVQTDPISNEVTIEPTNDYTLPDGTRMNGYFKKERVDWQGKQDISKESIVNLFTDVERQFDFSFKGDGSDGGLNIFAARFKAIYLNNKLINSVNNTNPENGIISAIPGASRYMFPSRFQMGSRNMVNRFFAATMHYKHTAWYNINELNGAIPADNVTPQLICIIPENVSDSSAGAISATFEPKIAYYAGKQPQLGIGGWRWIGDPAAPYTDGGIPNAIGFQIPYMFAVDYTGYVGTLPGSMPGPVLTYSNQLINGVVKPGLMKTYFLKRLAIMRNGKLYKPWLRLDLADITDWTHQNSIIIDGAVYHLIGIDSFDPLSEASCQCILWKVADPDASDLANSYPSDLSITTNPTILPQYDLKYGQLLLFSSDLPQIG